IRAVMAHKRVRNGKYHYTVSSKLLPAGRVYLTFDDEVEGDAYTKKLDALLAAGKVPSEFLAKKGAIITIADAIDQYLIALHVPESDHLLLAIARKRIGNSQIARLDYAWADSYVDGMKVMKLSPSTIRHHVGAVARCLDWVKRRGDTLMVSNPLRELPKRYASGHKEEVERDRRLEVHEEIEIRRILLGGKPKDKQRSFEFDNHDGMLVIFYTAVESGMRLAEIFTLGKTQIDFSKRTIFLDKTKNGDKRQVPMTTTLIGVLKPYVDSLKGEDLFEFEGTKKSISSRLSQTFGRVFEAAGCGDFTFHGTRHEATCRFYERTNLTDLEIAKILGWKSLRMALRYANLRASSLSEKMW
ncbi:MAG TPA: site-specific integrase, partial [Methylotenera sp.]|nr:site-specific integrase [Methylotenera sp.]